MPFGTQSALRLTAVDTNLGTARTLNDLPTLVTATQVSLALTRDQTLVLATQKDPQTVQVYELDPKQTRPVWTGYAALSGELDGDIFAPGEVFVPIVSSGAGQIKTVTRSTLRKKLGASSAGDQDADGVVDVLDDCPASYDPAQQGCPSPSDAVLYASYRLTLADRVRTSVNAALVSAGTQATVVGVDASVGAIQSKGAVTLKDRTRANGTVTSSGSITLLNGASAVTTKANVALSIGSLSSLAITFPPAGAPITLSPGQKRTITPGSFGDVHLYTGSTLTLTAGNYYFQSLFVEPQAVVVVDSRHGPVRVFAKTGLTFRGGVTSRTGGLSSSSFLLGYLGTAQAPIESGFDGTIVAPNAKLVLASLVHNGGFYAREIEVQAGATINYVPLTFSWFPT